MPILNQLKRFVAGHVTGSDLKKIQGSFGILEKKEVAANDWNALMGIALNQRKRACIDAETIACAQQLREELNGIDQDRVKELRAEVEAKKVELNKKKEEKIKKLEATAEKNKTSVRLEQYQKKTRKSLLKIWHTCMRTMVLI